MKKDERQRILKQLIIQNEIETQEELLELLKINGVKATQSTISRDAYELKIVKTYLENGKTKYVILAFDEEQNYEHKLRESLQEAFKKMERIKFILLIHTEYDRADVITNYLDDVGYEEIAGTVAGIDTILIITRSEKMAKTLEEKIIDLVY